MNGQDKGELELGGARLIDLVLERLRPQVDRIIISGNHDYGSGHDVLPDLELGPKGPSAGLMAMVQAHPVLEGFLTVPVDGPFFSGDLYERLFGKTSAIACGPEREHPTFAYWDSSELRRLFSVNPAKNWSLMDIADRLSARTVKFRAESYFKNFNAPEDLNFSLNA